MNKIKAQNKRAFTLTELLIVVIVIGVLSAVTLPKFNRVIENRKVTEAEEMMSAVRTEQERRCALDKNYTTKFSNLQDIIASNTTKNYTYSLQKQGISAKSNNADYTLKILSYEDGSYCCEGDGCKKLNKNYPDCAGLSFPESSCVGTESGDDGLGPDPEGKECTDGEVQGSQTCNGCGTQTTQLCVNGKWTDSLGTCSKTEEECKPKPECDEGDHRAYESCNKCGSRYLETCIDGKWQEVPTECTVSSPDECLTCKELCQGSSVGSICKHPDLEPPAGRKSLWKLWYPDKVTTNVKSCVECDILRDGGNYYYDEDGNLLGKQYDKENCSVLSDCPPGTIQLRREGIYGNHIICGQAKQFKPQSFKVSLVVDATGCVSKPCYGSLQYFKGGKSETRSCAINYIGGERVSFEYGCTGEEGAKQFCNEKCDPKESTCNKKCVDVPDTLNSKELYGGPKVKKCSSSSCHATWNGGYNPNFAGSSNNCAQGKILQDYAVGYECVRAN